MKKILAILACAGAFAGTLWLADYFAQDISAQATGEATAPAVTCPSCGVVMGEMSPSGSQWMIPSGKEYVCPNMACAMKWKWSTPAGGGPPQWICSTVSYPNVHGMVRLYKNSQTVYGQGTAWTPELVGGDLVVRGEKHRIELVRGSYMRLATAFTGPSGTYYYSVEKRLLPHVRWVCPHCQVTSPTKINVSDVGVLTFTCAHCGQSFTYNANTSQRASNYPRWFKR